MKQGDKILHDGDLFTVQQVYKTGWGDDSTLAFLMVKDVMPKPDIRWDVIPEPYNTFTVNEIGDLHFPTADCDNQWHDMGAAWADMMFPNRKYFIGQTFERPKGCDA